MKIDSTAFPIVRMQYNTPEPLRMEDALAEMSGLIARGKPFVFLAEGGLGDAHSDVSDHKKLTLWMKANKALIAQNIRAHVHVVADATEMQAANDFAPAFLKFWGYPMLVADSIEKGLGKAHELLAIHAR
jgi:hypothetical protein